MCEQERALSITAAPKPVAQRGQLASSTLSLLHRWPEEMPAWLPVCFPAMLLAPPAIHSFVQKRKDSVLVADSFSYCTHKQKERREN